MLADFQLFYNLHQQWWINLFLFLPDQDHNSQAVNEEDDNSNDIDLLRAKNVSLKIEIENCEVRINEKENELKNVYLEVSELSKAVHNLKKETNDKEEALDTATLE